MVYNIKKTDGTPLVSIPDSTQDTVSSSLTLTGRNAVNFGLSINQNFIDLLQNFANTSAPPNALQGQLWFDSINADLKVYNGNKWIVISTGIDGSSGLIDVEIGPNSTDVSLVVSEYQIVTAVSGKFIPRSDLPDNIVYNDISYAFAARFPNGLFAGLNIATDPAGIIDYWVQGKATKANVLTTARTVFINGVSTGQFKFDGSSNVNVSVTDSNVYVSSNVTVAGTWTKVLVSDGGRILAGNNITASDVVTALGYTPFSGGNVNVNAVGNTVVARDANANFAANVIIVNDFIANYTVQANVVSASSLIGTASNAAVLKDSRTIYLDGDIYGNVKFDGSSNVVINSNLVTSGVTAGVYNLVNVDSKGRVTNGGYYDMSPFNMICMFPSDGFIPAGYAECDGRTVVDITTGIITVTPNLVSASSNISAVSDIPLKYYIKYLVAPPPLYQVELAAGNSGYGPPVYINGTQVNEQPATSTATLSVTLTEGLTTTQIPQGFEPLTSAMSSPSSASTGGFTNTNFEDVTYFDAVALVMGLGDTNGIMFSTYDVWNNFTSLTVQNIIDNLTLRASQNLPAAAGKYMLTVSVLKEQVNNLKIPSNISFSPILQDQIMSSVTSSFAHQLGIANIPPVDNALFGCHYFSSAQAMIAVMKSNPTDIVATTLHNIGYYTSTTSNLDTYTRDQFLSIIADIVQESKAEIQNRRELNQNVITSGQWVSTSNANVIVTSPTVNGYYIGDNNFKDLQGGYFSEYDMLSTASVSSTDAIVGPAVEKGSIGTVSFDLADAGAAALAGVLQTNNIYDQAGQAQLCVNRTGASASGLLDFNGRNGFDVATAKDAFTALSAAIYGPNDDAQATALYGGLYINKDDLFTALGIQDKQQFMDSISGLFRELLTSMQLNRIYELRQQVIQNGPEMNQAQVAITNAVQSLPSTTPESSVVKKPFGADASGYLTTSSLEGYFISNSSDLTASSPAPSPQALLNRLMKNLENPAAPILNNTPTINQQSNAAPGGNVVTTTSNTNTATNSKTVSSQPSSSGGYAYGYSSGYGWWGFTW